MLLEYAENIAQLLANLIALLLCLFQYISNRKKAWIYATVIFLSSLMSCYYWTAYLVIMGDTPNVSNLFSYSGWNIAFAAVLLLVLHMESREERRFFHPLMLLPIPLNIWQLTLYLPFGGVPNSVYQVAVMTAVAVFSLQSICWRRKQAKEVRQRPYIAMAALLYALCEFGMWTFSCFDGPVSKLYYLFSFVSSISFLLLTGALALAFKAEKPSKRGGAEQRYQTILKAVYFCVVLICCVGGILLGSWMRSVMAAGPDNGANADVYNIIPVVLFIISLFLVAFAVAIIFVVNFGEKVAENNELREARYVAERSNAAKSEFLANVSHEIRTPINAVLGMNQMILRESLEGRDMPPRDPAELRRVFSDISDYAGNVENAGNNLLSIINDILDFSKIEAGRLRITEADYSLSSVLNDVSSMISFRAREKGLEFRVDVDDALPDGLRGDVIRVRQIMTNLLTNAVKYTNRGSVSLTVRGEASSAPEPGSRIRLKITVQDTGIGIRQEDVGKLFQKFERVDLRANSTVEGTGLGLAITSSLLEMMGGSIEVRSVYGEGSVFTAALPQTVVSTQPTGAFREKLRKSMDEAKAYRSSFRAPDARILIVDDTRMNLTVATGLLKKTQLGIDTAACGADAVALCRSRQYDLVLMDQRMPEMDGTEAMRRIRALGGANRETPFICLTADAVSGARERYLSEGFTDYLTKPIDSRALEKMLMQYLPAEKLLPAEQKDADPDEPALPTDRCAALRAAGIEPETGLRYSENRADMYEMLLRDYLHSAREKLQAMDRAREAQDWHTYAVHVHALKSSSRMIGAAALSNEAAALEAAADAGQADAVGRGHGNLAAHAADLIEALRRIVGEGDDRTDELEADGVMEFLP